MTPLVLPLRDACHEPSVGGKARNLARLMALDAPVPDGVVLTRHAFDMFAGADGLGDKIATLCAALSAESEVDVVRRAAVDGPRVGDGGPVAGGRRGKPSSGGRRLARRRDVRRAKLRGGRGRRAVLVCGAVRLGPGRRHAAGLARRGPRLLGVVLGRTRDGVSHTPAARPPSGMGVVIQRQVNAVAAGVLFTRPPEAGADDDRMIVEFCAGLADQLVAGAIDPARCELSRSRMVVTRQAPPPGRPDVDVEHLLSARRASDLARLALRLEHALGGPQDIEWAIDADGRIAIVQARPITTRGSAVGHGSRRLGPVEQRQRQRELSRAGLAAALFHCRDRLLPLLPQPRPGVRRLAAPAGGDGPAAVGHHRRPRRADVLQPHQHPRGAAHGAVRRASCRRRSISSSASTRRQSSPHTRRAGETGAAGSPRRSKLSASRRRRPGSTCSSAAGCRGSKRRPMPLPPRPRARRWPRRRCLNWASCSPLPRHPLPALEERVAVRRGGDGHLLAAAVAARAQRLHRVNATPGFCAHCPGVPSSQPPLELWALSRMVARCRAAAPAVAEPGQRRGDRRLHQERPALRERSSCLRAVSGAVGLPVVARADAHGPDVRRAAGAAHRSAPAVRDRAKELAPEVAIERQAAERRRETRAGRPDDGASSAGAGDGGLGADPVDTACGRLSRARATEAGAALHALPPYRPGDWRRAGAPWPVGASRRRLHADLGRSR